MNIRLGMTMTVVTYNNYYPFMLLFRVFSVLCNYEFLNRRIGRWKQNCGFNLSISQKQTQMYICLQICCLPTHNQLSYTKIKPRLFSEYTIYIRLSYGFIPVVWDEEKTRVLLGNRAQKTQAKSLELGLGWDTALIP